mmetsp:Transcript_66665/g.216971  ORF Transcript_66665/g.216971 Transcript_66665/m.216971 type:complete len:218 (-) Transcript_66665:403-1056(-)
MALCSCTFRSWTLNAFLSVSFKPAATEPAAAPPPLLGLATRAIEVCGRITFVATNVRGGIIGPVLAALGWPAPKSMAPDAFDCFLAARRAFNCASSAALTPSCIWSNCFWVSNNRLLNSSFFAGSSSAAAAAATAAAEPAAGTEAVGGGAGGGGLGTTGIGAAAVAVAGRGGAGTSTCAALGPSTSLAAARLRPLAAPELGRGTGCAIGCASGCAIG